MPVDDIEPNEFRARVKAGERLFLLDVREPDEVASWAFPNALNIPMSVLAARVGELPTDQPIVVACHSGVRSASVAAALVGAGWNACNLAGGALAWVSTGDPDAGPVPN